MRLFQIEEPEGGPADPDASGAAIGIDVSGGEAEVAMSVGGNAVLLSDRPGFEQSLAVPAVDAVLAEWLTLFEGVRLRAERALARPVTHAVVVYASASPAAAIVMIEDAAEQASLRVLRCTPALDPSPPGTAPALAAAILAEDLVPRGDGEGQ